MKKYSKKYAIIVFIVLSFFMMLTSCASISYDKTYESKIDKDPERRDPWTTRTPSGYPIGP